MARVLAYTFAILGCLTMLSDLKAEVLKIGVRADTPPFVSIDQKSGAFEGFFYTVCTLAVTRAGYQFKELPLTAQQRNALLESGTSDLDLLCDPTTINLHRMENFAIAKSKSDDVPHLTYSQIIFVANGGFVNVKSASDAAWQDAVKMTAEGLKDKQPPTCDEFFKSAEANLAAQDDRSSASPKNNKPFIVFRFEPEAPPTSTWLLGYVVGSTIGEKVFEFKEDNVHPFACTFPSHFDAAKAFCSGKVHRYYGDIDIIRASIAEYRDMTGAPCEADVAASAKRTYEPYAFVISSRVPEFKERFVCAIYSMFQDKTMDILFEGYFPEGKTERLDTLFWINSIPSGSRSANIPAPFVCGTPK